MTETAPPPPGTPSRRRRCATTSCCAPACPARGARSSGPCSLVAVDGRAWCRCSVQLPFALVVRSCAGSPWSRASSRLLDLGDPTPAGLAYLNLTLASAIPVPGCWSARCTACGRAGWPRWRPGSAGAGSRPAWGSRVLALLAHARGLVAAARGRAGHRDVRAPQRLHAAPLRDFLLVVLLLTPLQAAGEEYAFRGYLTQAFGGALPAPRCRRSSAPALLFALAHGAAERAGLLRPVRLRRSSPGCW